MRHLIAILAGLMLIFFIFYIYDSESNMKTSDSCVEMIKEFEGKKQVAYQDPAGVRELKRDSCVLKKLVIDSLWRIWKKLKNI